MDHDWPDSVLGGGYDEDFYERIEATGFMDRPQRYRPDIILTGKPENQRREVMKIFEKIRKLYHVIESIKKGTLIGSPFFPLPSCVESIALYLLDHNPAGLHEMLCQHPHLVGSGSDHPAPIVFSIP